MKGCHRAVSGNRRPFEFRLQRRKTESFGTLLKARGNEVVNRSGGKMSLGWRRQNAASIARTHADHRSLDCGKIQKGEERNGPAGRARPGGGMGRGMY